MGQKIHFLLAIIWRVNWIVLARIIIAMLEGNRDYVVLEEDITKSSVSESTSKDN